jgi:hypothetical protein
MRRVENYLAAGSDLKTEPMLVLNSRVKGGHYVAREVTDSSAKDALPDYLAVAGHLQVLKIAAPYWARYDRAGRLGEPLTSYSYADNMKRY